MSDKSILQRVIVGATGWAQTLPIGTWASERKAKDVAHAMDVEMQQMLRYELVAVLPSGDVVPVGMDVETLLKNLGIVKVAHHVGPIDDHGDVVTPPEKRIIV